MKDLQNIRFGRLVALEIVGKSTSHGGNLWRCMCDCGAETIVPTSKLTSGRTKSCGCYMRDMARKNHIKHGYTKHAEKKPRLFKIWLAMRERCYYRKNVRYNAYGARGIQVCKEWQEFENFKNWALSNGYTDELTIDRIDSDGDYCPHNCQWVSKHFNSIKQRKAILLNCSGEVKSITGWSKALHISPVRLKKVYIEKGKEGAEDFVCSMI